MKNEEAKNLFSLKHWQYRRSKKVFLFLLYKTEQTAASTSTSWDILIEDHEGTKCRVATAGFTSRRCKGWSKWTDFVHILNL